MQTISTKNAVRVVSNGIFITHFPTYNFLAYIL